MEVDEMLIGRWSLDSSVVALLAALLSLPFYFVWADGTVYFAPLFAFWSPLQARLVQPQFGVPLALIAIPLLTVLVALRWFKGRFRGPREAPSLFLVAMLGWMSLVAVYGALAFGQPRATAALFAQTSLPALVFIAISGLALDKRRLARALLLIPLVGSVSIVLIFAVHVYFQYLYVFPSGAELSSLRSLMMTRVFYGARNVQPVVVVVGLTVLLAQLASRDRRLSSPVLWTLLVLHSAYLLINWSRSGLLMTLVVVALWLGDQVLVRTRRDGSTKSAFWLERGGLASLILVFAISSLIVGSVRHEARLKSTLEASGKGRASEEEKTGAADAVKGVHPAPRSEGGVPPAGKQPLQEAGPPATDSDRPEASGRDVESRMPGDRPLAEQSRTSLPKPVQVTPESRPAFGLERRRGLLIGAIALVLESPFVGDAFVPVGADSVIVGRKVEEHRIYPAHNQYLDLAIRGGLPTAVLFIGFLISTARVLWRESRKARGALEGEIARSALFLVIAASAGAMFQLYFVVTQSALLLFLIIAVALQLVARERDSRGSA